ncbi:aldo/keto reductase [Malonomonas rubra]|uniref:aldo/keto reductase n=1 Tax=Malonomonas rubra TaxID=57040 RepID=UPI0026E9F02B|nr:aldo/keto reductase [Malonomonas rubra]
MVQQKRYRFGRTNLKISRLVYGSLPLGPLQANVAPEEGGELIRHAIKLGVNVIDTAELYGTYRHIREGLKGVSQQPHIISKTHAATAVDARRHVERALNEMNVQKLDVLHIHGARLVNPFIDRAEVLAEMKSMQREGLVDYLGLSTHYICAVKQAAEHPDIDVIHPLINRDGMGILDGTPAEMAEAIAYAAKCDKGIYGMKALAGGNLIKEARECFRFVLNLPGMHALAIGMLSKEEIEGNYKLLTTGEAEATVWEQLEKRERQIQIMEQFCKGCGACIPACTNHGIFLENGKAKIIKEACILCGYCAAACPEFIIRVV